MYGIVKEISDKVKNNRTGREVFFSLVEEVGELSQEVNVRYNKETYKKSSVDGILGESVDAIICLLDLLIVEGYSEEDVKKTMVEKCNKWKRVTGGN